MADKTTPTNTAWRYLDRNLILLTRQRLGSAFDWGLPVIEVAGNATLRSVSFSFIISCRRSHRRI